MSDYERAKSCGQTADVLAQSDVRMLDFERLMKPLFDEQECVEDESRRLASLRDTLLPKLMSGELQVNA